MCSQADAIAQADKTNTSRRLNLRIKQEHLTDNISVRLALLHHQRPQAAEEPWD